MLPYWSNPPFLIFDIRALWRSRLSARAPECQKLKMWVRPVSRWTLEQQQFGTAGVEGVKQCVQAEYISFRKHNSNLNKIALKAKVNFI